MKYRIAGANATTGKDVEIELEALSERDAIDEARRQGIFISSIKPIGHPPPTSPPIPATRRAGHAIGQSVGGMSGGKLFFIITFAVAAGLTVAFIAYGIFFAATGPKHSRVSRPTAHLGENEKAFIDYIHYSNEDLIRDSLTKSLDWKAVATPALLKIVSMNKLEVWTYDSEDRAKERQFFTDLADRMIKNGADVNAALQEVHDVNTLRFLISRKADVNSRPDGQPVLHRLTSDMWDDCVALLIASGANVNATGWGGNTPLHNAAKDGAVKVINRLLAAGAQINAKNASGQTPLAIANLAMQKEAAALLKSRGGTE